MRFGLRDDASSLFDFPRQRRFSRACRRGNATQKSGHSLRLAALSRLWVVPTHCLPTHGVAPFSLHPPTRHEAGTEYRHYAISKGLPERLGATRTV